MRRSPRRLATLVGLLGPALASVASPARADAQPAVRRVEVVLRTDAPGSLISAVGAELRAAGFVAVSGPADARLEVTPSVTEDACEVRATLSAPRGDAIPVTLADASAPCSPDTTMAPEARVLGAARAAVSRLLSVAGPPAPVLVVKPPPPPPPPPPPLPPPLPGDGWVFEAGVNLRTHDFYGLGHTVLGTDETDRFRGVFMLSAVKNETEHFDGALLFALGKNDAKRFRGGFAIGLLTNDVRDFAGVAQVGLRLSEARDFIGLTQVTVGVGKAKRFVGLAQIGGGAIAGELTALAQVGLVAGTERSFVGAVQVGLLTGGRKAWSGGASVAVVSFMEKGTWRGVAQVGGLSVVKEVDAAAQVSGLNVTDRFRGGLQIGVVTYDGGKLREVFDSPGPGKRAHFEGGLQLGVVNAVGGTFAGGVQGALAVNYDRSSFQGLAQASLFTNYVGGDFEGVLEVGAANFVIHRFSGLAQVGGGNFAARVHGAQIGLVNIASREVRGAQLGVGNVGGDVRGVQIGLFNKAKRLRGLQLGLVNMVDRPVPVVPIVNLGF